MNIEFPDDSSMDDLVEAARRHWAERHIQPRESYFAFAKRVGVSYRTVLRWMGRSSSRDRIVKRAMDGHADPALEPVALPFPIVWTIADLRIYRGPLVYVVIRENRPIYVGSSKNGGARLLGSLGHHDHMQAFLDTASHVYLYPCHTRREALELESRLIAQYQPLLNLNQT